MILFWDKDGKPLEVLEWAPLYQDDDYRRVALTDVGRYRVSTIWEGLHRGAGLVARGMPPMIFETAVFDGTNRASEECFHYPTLAAAIAGHDQIVADYRRRQEPK